MYNLLLSGIPLNIDWRQILLHLLNLVILFLILYFLLYNPVKKFMEKRKKYYEQQDEQSKKTLAEAEKKKAEYDALLSKADAEISEKKRFAIADARAESERIIKAAEENASAALKKANAQADEIKKTRRRAGERRTFGRYNQSRERKNRIGLFGRRFFIGE